MLTAKQKKEIATSWGMKVKDVDWEFVSKISKKGKRRKKK